VENINIVIPMAGEGRRFREAGYTFPKPLIEVHGKPMIESVYRTLPHIGRPIFIARTIDSINYNLEDFFHNLNPKSVLTTLDDKTEGAACTVLTVSNLIDNNDPLLIVNSDQICYWSTNDALHWFNLHDGGIITFRATHPKWSYVKVVSGHVEEVAEKRVISDMATTGIYFWKKGSDFVKYAQQMIDAEDRVNNEFYIAPVYNYAIRDGKQIVVHMAKEMHGLGDPESLQRYLKL